MVSLRQRSGNNNKSPANGLSLYRENHAKSSAVAKLTRQASQTFLMIALPALLFSIFLAGRAWERSWSHDRTQDGISPTLHRRSLQAFTPVPPKNRRTFFTDDKKISQPIQRAFRSRGWRKADRPEDAHYVWTYTAVSRWYRNFHPWQRYNHIPNYHSFNRKDTFVEHFKKYETTHPNKPQYFLPETYRLSIPAELQAFESRLIQENGMDQPWVLKQPSVNQGRGIRMLGPRSKELEKLLAMLQKQKGKMDVKKKDQNENNNDDSSDDDDDGLIVQSYICNEMTWNSRKFDVRMFWLVASLDPLIVLYHDGYVRIGNSEYDETDFKNTRKHLTTHTGLAEEGKATFLQFADRITQHYNENAHTIAAGHRDIALDPVAHVRNQFKESIATTIDAFREVTFQLGDMTTENGIGFYGADYVMDNDLDVWLIEPQNGCGLDEDHNFRVEMHNQMFGTMVDVEEEIWRKQESSQPVLPLEKLGQWQVVYAGDEYSYEYQGYQRSKQKKQCALPPSKQKKKEEEEEGSSTTADASKSRSKLRG